MNLFYKNKLIEELKAENAELLEDEARQNTENYRLYNENARLRDALKVCKDVMVSSTPDGTGVYRRWTDAVKMANEVLKAGEE